MNPGAPEFTPRTHHPAHSVIASPIRRNWADDVENEATHPKKSPMEDDGSSGQEWEALANFPRAPPNTVAASPEERKQTSQERMSESPDIKPRRNTLQSVSCPDPPLVSSLQCSPSRSVSQPIPSPRVPTQPLIENIAPEGRYAVAVDPPKESASGPKPVAANTQLPQTSTRGRGVRGRGYRGRYRGKGRRNTSNPKQNHSARTSSAPQSASKSDRGQSAAS